MTADEVPPVTCVVFFCCCCGDVIKPGFLHMDEDGDFWDERHYTRPSLHARITGVLDGAGVFGSPDAADALLADPALQAIIDFAAWADGAVARPDMVLPEIRALLANWREARS